MQTSNVSELALSSLVYVSRSALAIDGDAREIDRIVEVSVARNRSLRVTGSLLYTQLHFAQVLEGPAPAIANLMASIASDQRHCDVTVVAETRIASRRFANWSMAYAGPMPYFDRQLKPLMNPLTTGAQSKQMVERLVSNLRQLHPSRGG